MKSSLKSRMLRMTFSAAIMLVAVCCITLPAKAKTITYNCTNATGNGPGKNLVKGYDYDNTYWDGSTYWTASNGVILKAIPYYNYDYTEIEHYEPLVDGQGADLMEGSPYWTAVEELNVLNGYYPPNSNVHVPQEYWLPVAGSKRTSFDFWNNADFNRFADKFHELSMRREHGEFKAGLRGEYELVGAMWYAQPYIDAGKGDGSFTIRANHRFKFVDGYGRNNGWSPPDCVAQYGEDAIFLRITNNPLAYEWDAIHNIIRYLTPDAEAIYQTIYNDYYFRNQGLKTYDTWQSVGASSAILKPYPYEYDEIEGRELAVHELRGICYVFR